MYTCEIMNALNLATEDVAKVKVDAHRDTSADYMTIILQTFILTN